jgi:hypothetical protein
MDDPRENVDYKQALEQTTNELEKVLRMLKNGECVIIYSMSAPLVMKTGKGKTPKQTNTSRLMIDYMRIGKQKGETDGN